MRRKSLIEEIERIHFLTYNNKGLVEQIITSILDSGTTPKSGDVSKTNDLTSNIDAFYNDLEQAKDNGGLSQQPHGSMQYKKEVESMQIGLMLLGYDLPRFGVDGLYGPETQSAVTAFKHANAIQGSSNADVQTIDTLIQQLKNKNISSNDIGKHIDTVITGGSPQFTDLDLNTDDGFKSYAEICQKFIDQKQPNPLNITGEMLANGAKEAFNRFHKYVPPELALSQLLIEGGIGNNNPNSRPILTKNPFNIGNIDSGSNTSFNDTQYSINRYFDLIASYYLGKGKTATDLIQNFVNKNGNRYASDGGYENKLNSIAMLANRVSQSVLSNINYT